MQSLISINRWLWSWKGFKGVLILRKLSSPRTKKVLVWNRLMTDRKHLAKIVVADEDHGNSYGDYGEVFGLIIPMWQSQMSSKVSMRSWWIPWLLFLPFSSRTLSTLTINRLSHASVMTGTICLNEFGQRPSTLKRCWEGYETVGSKPALLGTCLILDFRPMFVASCHLRNPSNVEDLHRSLNSKSRGKSYYYDPHWPPTFQRPMYPFTLTTPSVLTGIVPWYTPVKWWGCSSPSMFARQIHGFWYATPLDHWHHHRKVTSFPSWPHSVK